MGNITVYSNVGFSPHLFVFSTPSLTTLRFGNGSGFTRGSFRGLDLLRGAAVGAGLRAALILTV